MEAIDLENDETTGQMTFVASDLEEKIRRSSAAMSLGDSSTPPRSPLSPDPEVLQDLEMHARSIAAQIDTLLRDLRGSLRGMSDLTLESINCYSTAVSSTCDSVDTAIKSTYHMLAKAEELNDAMKPLAQLSSQIKEIKAFLDMIESHLHAPSS